MTESQQRSNRVVTIVGFVLAFIGFLNVAGLILSLIALIRSRRAGQRNGLALAGVIIAAVGVAFIAVLLVVLVPILVDAAQTCSRLGEGVHVVGGSTYTCTGTSFSVSSRP
ncbi:TMEM43 family protein [Rathayibacter sp. VKM Ac-2926]|uniref:TMEM43 family protein n=1 Tax=Rathayibacter sp. VKM Ac-2926 TaxID=2929477 RepID=UPI001FB2D677|nr:TMEM43 family protein [Rathayibacter sp. VKM Ac-2926]MCJ1703746.1 TMEM43 family protein [Rathayibacter sp. VKM Ac-2926]